MSPQRAEYWKRFLSASIFSLQFLVAFNIISRIESWWIGGILNGLAAMVAIKLDDLATRYCDRLVQREYANFLGTFIPPLIQSKRKRSERVNWKVEGF
jgi:hypothetical protein